MKYLQTFNAYNEEVRLEFGDYGMPKLTGVGKALKKVAIGGAVVGGLALGGQGIYNALPDKPSASYEETVGNFREYSLKTTKMDDNVNFTINTKNGFVGSRTSVSSGKSSRSRYTITIPLGTNYIYYDSSTLGSYVYTSDNISDLDDPSDVININGLEVVESGSNYKILKVSSFWSNLDFIFVNNGFSNPTNNFTVDGQTYTYFEKNFGFASGDASFVIPIK